MVKASKGNNIKFYATKSAKKSFTRRFDFSNISVTFLVTKIIFFIFFISYKKVYLKGKGSRRGQSQESDKRGGEQKENIARKAIR